VVGRCWLVGHKLLDKLRCHLARELVWSKVALCVREVLLPLKIKVVVVLGHFRRIHHITGIVNTTECDCRS